MDLNNISNKLKAELVATLKLGLKPTSNGTEVLDVVEDGTDDYEQYPVIRVVPATVSREVDSQARKYTYTPAFVVSIYLSLGQSEYPDAEVIKTLLELVDMVYDILDGHDYTSAPSGSTVLQQSSIISDINTLKAKTGSVVYCDIQYPISVTMGL